MMVPWYYVLAGLFCGGFVGLLVGCICAVSGRESEQERGEGIE